MRRLYVPREDGHQLIRAHMPRACFMGSSGGDITYLLRTAIAGQVAGSIADLVNAIEGRSASVATAGSIAQRINAISAFDGSTTSISLVRPALTDAITVTDGGAWTLGGWTEIVAAAVLTSHSLVAIVPEQGSLAAAYEVEIGEGGAGSEAVIARTVLRVVAGTNASHPIYIVPARDITANARVAARIASSVGGATMRFHLIFLPRPF
jgi:hypothetical protein